MGIDATASLGYGIKISDKKIIKAYNEDDDDMFDDKSFTVMSHGGYDESGSICFCIAKSEKMIFCWDQPKEIVPDKLAIGDDWDEKLKAWAVKHKIKKPKIGWWLCCSMG